MKDKILEKEISNLKKLSQRQYSLSGQLHYLKIIANKFGLYDASDYLTSLLFYETNNE